MTTQLTEWRPFGQNLFPELPTLFNEFLRKEWPLRGGNGEGWTPRVELTESPNAYEVRAELPGCKADDIKVNLTGNTLSIQGEKRQEERRAEDNVHIYERSYGMFQRTFNLPNPVDADSVKAETQDGVLTVKIDKATTNDSHDVKVESR